MTFDKQRIRVGLSFIGFIGPVIVPLTYLVALASLSRRAAYSETEAQIAAWGDFQAHVSMLAAVIAMGMVFGAGFAGALLSKRQTPDATVTFPDKKQVNKLLSLMVATAFFMPMLMYLQSAPPSYRGRNVTVAQMQPSDEVRFEAEQKRDNLMFGALMAVIVAAGIAQVLSDRRPGPQ
jgi:hypothetical protein